MIIERKGALDEFAANCLVPEKRARFEGHLDRMRDRCLHPLLLLEGNAVTLQTPTDRTQTPGLAIDSFQRLLLSKGVSLLLLHADTIPQRRATGEWAARLLINAALVTEHPSWRPSRSTPN